MKLLAWDTSSVTGTVVTSEWDPSRPLVEARLISEWTLSVDATHSEGLLTAIHRVLSASKWELKDVDIFGVGIGPGSFTGLRIGLTTARTWGEAQNKPVVGVCSLSVLARPLALTAKSGKLAISRNAFGGEVFVLHGPAKVLARVSVAPEKGFKSAWSRDAKMETMELSKFQKKFRTRQTSHAAHPFADVPQGRVLAALCWEGIRAGCARKAAEIQPLYMRESSAQVKMARGELKISPVDG